MVENVYDSKTDGISVLYQLYITPYIVTFVTIKIETKKLFIILY